MRDPKAFGQLRAVHHPGQVGHLAAVFPHRPSNPETGGVKSMSLKQARGLQHFPQAAEIPARQGALGFHVDAAGDVPDNGQARLGAADVTRENSHHLLLDTLRRKIEPWKISLLSC